MSAAEQAAETPLSHPEGVLEGGTYEVIRHRLAHLGKELQQRLDRLHQECREVFGTIELALLATERLTTAHNCVPRDMVVIGTRLLLGYNVQFGLKVEPVPADIFSVYEYRHRAFSEASADILADPRFQHDFRELYRYYRHTTFVKFAVHHSHLFMVFRIGKGVSDIKTFKWLLHEDGLRYIDNRSEHELHLPPQHAFAWQRTQRDFHHFGPHPHISIEDRIFVETVGGDLTVKIENNTQSGAGIYSEPVDNPDQTLDDAEIYYAILGSIILLKIRPYQERTFRYIAYNDKVQQAQRLDARDLMRALARRSWHRVFMWVLPADRRMQGVCKRTAGMLFEQCIASPNGEDFLYVFSHRDTGVYILLPYNLIDQELATPIVCNAYALFEPGDLILCKTNETPQKHHAVQIWQSPFVGSDAALVPSQKADSYLSKIGSRELVQGMAECPHEILTLLHRDLIYANLYVDLVKRPAILSITYLWLGSREVAILRKLLEAVRASASTAVSEFDKVVQVQRNTRNQVEQVSQATRTLLSKTHHQRCASIDEFVEALADLRELRGHIISLRDLRYIDLDAVTALETDVQQETARLGQQCVKFLLQPDALAPYAQRVIATLLPSMA